ncbi:hypothetical protein MMC25_008042 [Agyrium rufum]|nr:hypothetical protein [Agyrium rufum]
MAEDGETFIKNLAQFVRTHEKSLANALLLQRQASRNSAQSNAGSGDVSNISISSQRLPSALTSSSSALAAALSFGALNFTSNFTKTAKLTLTPHHLFYLLSKYEELDILVGPMNIRLENIHSDTTPGNYVSFLNQSHLSKGRSDRDSIHTVSSVRSVVSGISGLWSNLGLSSSATALRSEKAKVQLHLDTKYLYSAFTKIPCLSLSPDRQAQLIRGYEEFPFDSAVPLLVFKNLSVLEIQDLDFRQFFGWDTLAEQLRSLTLRRANLDDPLDLLIGIVLDDMDKRRRRSSKSHGSPSLAYPSSPSPRFFDFSRTHSAPGSPTSDHKLGRSSSSRNSTYLQSDAENARVRQHHRTKSSSPTRPVSSRQSSSYKQMRGGTSKLHRSGSTSSQSSTHSIDPARARSSSSLHTMGILPGMKWRFLRHLSLAENGLTFIPSMSLAPLGDTLQSLDLSANLFSEIPEPLASLSSLRALNLSNCMIDSLHSLIRHPLPAITALNLRGNRLCSIVGVERLLSLERLDLRDNQIADPMEMARLTGTPELKEIYVTRNPLVRLHPSYRITILNLFRGTPGYTEDPVLDSLPPSYSERRQLRDRVIESGGTHLVKPLPIASQDMPLEDSQGDPESDTSRHHEASNGFYMYPSREIHEATVGSNRRRKPTRRKIVDLAGTAVLTNTSATPVAVGSRRPQVAFADLSSDTNMSESSSKCVAVPEAVHSSIEHESGEFQLIPQDQSNLTDPRRGIVDTLQHVNLEGEAYRRKVEALKEEFGSGWLNILNDDIRSQQLQSSQTSRSELGVGQARNSELRAQTRGTVIGGRTFG